MKRYLPFLIVFGFLMMPALVPLQAEPASEFPDYFTIKGGYYYPSEQIHASQFSSTDFDKKKGADAEIAFGHYFAPFFGTELVIGYLEDRRFPASGEGRARLEALPVLLSAKLFLPLGPVEPYGEIGVGAYFTKFEVEGDIGGPRAFRKVNFGPHAGVGINFNFTRTFYLGLEGRYRRVRPEYGGETARLDGYTATVNLGFRYR